MKAKLFTCARGVSIDRHSNNLSIFEVVEDVAPAAYPAMLAKFNVVLVVEKDVGDPDQCTLILDVKQSNQAAFSHPIEIDFDGKRRSRSVVEFPAIPLMNPGTLSLVMKDETGKFRAQYDIDLRPPPSPVGPPETHSVAADGRTE